MGLFNFFHTNQKQPTENQPTQDLLSTTQGGVKMQKAMTTTYQIQRKS